MPESDSRKTKIGVYDSEIKNLLSDIVERKTRQFNYMKMYGGLIVAMLVYVSYGISINIESDFPPPKQNSVVAVAIPDREPTKLKDSYENTPSDTNNSDNVSLAYSSLGIGLGLIFALAGIVFTLLTGVNCRGIIVSEKNIAFLREKTETLIGKRKYLITGNKQKRLIGGEVYSIAHYWMLPINLFIGLGVGYYFLYPITARPFVIVLWIGMLFMTFYPLVGNVFHRHMNIAEYVGHACNKSEQDIIEELKDYTVVDRKLADSGSSMVSEQLMDERYAYNLYLYCEKNTAKWPYKLSFLPNPIPIGRYAPAVLLCSFVLLVIGVLDFASVPNLGRNAWIFVLFEILVFVLALIIQIANVWTRHAALTRKMSELCIAED